MEEDSTAGPRLWQSVSEGPAGRVGLLLIISSLLVRGSMMKSNRTTDGTFKDAQHDIHTVNVTKCHRSDPSRSEMIN